jgi:hypothetical protein
MKENVDAYVSRPSVAVNKKLSRVFIQFETMDPDTMKGIGTSHTVAMTTSDAMQLWRILSEAQKRLSLPSPSVNPAMIEIPAKRRH